jgi:hypothetical protein
MDKLDKNTFKRFKLIESLINKYPIVKFDVSDIKKIKDLYIEYTPEYQIVKSNLKFSDSNFLGKIILGKLNSYNEFIHISETPNIDIKISYDNISTKVINMVYSIVKLFHKIHGIKKIELKIGYTNINKEINGDIISAEHTNSGLNYVGTGKIEIFRKEELIKVLCHELSHAYSLDCARIDNYEKNITQKFKINTFRINASINEAFTEYIAMQYHIAIISYYTNQSILLIYHYEKMWSLYQVCKILNHYNMKSFEDLYKYEFKQGTNVFSYYIIKYFLIYKLDNKCSYKNLIDILNDNEIIKIINENCNQNFDNNLRMTLFEIDIN